MKVLENLANAEFLDNFENKVNSGEQYFVRDCDCIAPSPPVPDCDCAVAPPCLRMELNYKELSKRSVYEMK